MRVSYRNRQLTETQMINREQFELEKQATEWLMGFGITPQQAMVVISNSIQRSISLSQSFVDLLCEIDESKDQK